MDYLDLHDPGPRRPTMRPPSRTQTRIALVVVALAVGLLVGVQARTRGDATARLAAEAPEDLARILSDLNEEADQLARQLADLRLRLFRYEGTAERGDLALRDARKTLRDLQVLAGTTEVRGPGLRVDIADQMARVSWEPMLDLVQELRDAGAEAIAVSGVRVVASSWFGPGDAGITIDGEHLVPPYRIEAIGDPPGLREALGIPGGPISLIEAQPGVSISAQELDRMRLPALRREITFRYARPAS
ncbi:MAG TPA: DUF881 domain-containing protein [Actinomycetota bacterium]